MKVVLMIIMAMFHVCHQLEVDLVGLMHILDRQIYFVMLAFEVRIVCTLYKELFVVLIQTNAINVCHS